MYVEHNSLIRFKVTRFDLNLGLLTIKFTKMTYN